MLLVHPPSALPGEPPAGIAKLSGALRNRGIRHRLLDANLEGMLYLLGLPQPRFDTWTDRAYRSLPRHLEALRGPGLYRSRARYGRTVADVNRVLEAASAASGASVGLEDFQHAALSPLRSADLLRSAERPEENIFYPYFSSRLTSLIEAERPALLGISLNYLSQALTAFAMTGFVKQRFPGVRTVMGGGLMTSWLRSGDRGGCFAGLIDHAVAGPGEEKLLSLCGAAGMPGRSRPDLDGLPLGDYLAPGLILPYSATQGCWWNKCTFCPEPAEGSRFTARPPAEMIEDITALSAVTPPVLIHLLDNAVPPPHLKALAEVPLPAPWYGFARVTEDLADDDFCRLLHRSGCAMLKLGLESGDQKVLDALRKGLDLGIASRALRSLKRAGIMTYVYLLFGTPAETRESARRTLEFTAQHADAIGHLNLAIFNMPVSGDEARQYGTRSFYDGDLSLYTDFVHPAGWDRKAVRSFLDGEFKRHPLIRPVVLRDVPSFGSCHAALFAGSNP